MITLLIMLVWFGAGVPVAPFTYARWLAWGQRKWPTRAHVDAASDRSFALVMAAIGLLMGPASIILALIETRGYGLMWHAYPPLNTDRKD